MLVSRFNDVKIPEQSIFDYLFSDIDGVDLDRIALIDSTSGQETTFRELIAQVDLFAGALHKRGLGVGDVIGILSPNISAFATVFHGILEAGATATTFNALYTSGEIASQLKDSGAKWLVTVSALLPGALKAFAELDLPSEQIIVIDGAEGHLGLRDLLAECNARPEVTFDPKTHLAVLPYSSGTTGKPKGVMLTHQNLVANVHQSRELITLDAEDRVLAILPFFHIYGMTVLLNFALKQRASLVTMPKFELVNFLEVIEKYGTSWVFIAPPIAVALAKHPMVEKYDMSSVEVIFSGAAPLDGTLAKLVAERLNCKVYQGYGLTETSPVLNAIPYGREDIDPSSVGLLVPNTQARIVDPETHEDVTVPAEGQSEPGELWVRGPQVMLGYLNRPEETDKILDAEGWLRTGDIATVTAEGVYYLVDRLKELIKYKGYQVAPAILEAVLLENPDIADAAVVGAYDAEGQEVPKAFVVLQEGVAQDPEAIMEHLADRVAPYQKVRMVEFIDAIPKSSAGKILRRELRK